MPQPLDRGELAVAADVGGVGGVGDALVFLREVRVAQQALLHRDHAVGDVAHVRGVDGLAEGAVVADDDDGALVFVDRLEQRGDGLDVEVVGRLVEQDDVARGEAECREGDARLRAARELPDEPRRLLAHEA